MDGERVDGRIREMEDSLRNNRDVNKKNEKDGGGKKRWSRGDGKIYRV